MRREQRYSYIWCSTRPPPWRGMRWALLVAGAIILGFFIVEGVTIEWDPTLRYALSLIEQLLH